MGEEAINASILFKSYNSTKYHKRCLLELHSGKRQTLPEEWKTANPFESINEPNISGDWLIANNARSPTTANSTTPNSENRSSYHWLDQLTRDFCVDLDQPEQSRNWMIRGSPSNRGAAQTARQRQQSADKLNHLKTQLGRTLVNSCPSHQGIPLKFCVPENFATLDKPAETSMLRMVMDSENEDEPLVQGNRLIFHPEAIDATWANQVKLVIIKMIQQEFDISIKGTRAFHQALQRLDLAAQILCHQFTRSALVNKVIASINENGGFKVIMNTSGTRNAVKFFIKKKSRHHSLGRKAGEE